MPRDAAALAWMANLACLELHPHPVRAEDLDHPDELRVDLDPVPGVEWPQVQRGRAGRARDARRSRADRLAEDLGLARHPRQRAHRAAVDVRPRCGARRWRWRAKWSGARRRSRPASGGRRSATASSSTTTRTPRTAPSRPRTRCGPTPDARVSAPLTWDEIDECDPADFTLADDARAVRRGSAIGMPAIDDHAGSLEALLELSARHEREGQGDAPWPPQYKKQPGEPPRVQPSRRRRAATAPSAAPSAPGRRAPKHPLIEIGRRRGRTRRWPASSAGRRGILTRRRAPRSRPTCWSTRCAADRRRGRACASTCSTCRRRCGRRRKPLDPGRGAGRTAGPVSANRAGAPKTFASS